MCKPYAKPVLNKESLTLQTVTASGQVTGAIAPSDIRLKTDIARTGKTAGGIPLYQFRYKSGPERYEGVMAQDVLAIMPEAVAIGTDGYLQVDYDSLGLALRRI